MTGARWSEPDGGEVAIVSRGDGFDLYAGKKEFVQIPIYPKTAVRLSFWIVRWWVFSDLCGLKSWWRKRRLTAMLNQRERAWNRVG